MLETATESVMEQMLLETILSIEKEIVQEEWEMAIVNYADGKYNFTRKLLTYRRN